MSIYFIEPYNAYIKKKAKTPQQEIYEQNLQAELIGKIMNEARNASLPTDAPNVSSATAVGMGAAGGGGVPEIQLYRQTVNGTISPINATGIAPFTVNFQNPSSKYVSVVWDFGDGEYAGGPSVTHTYRITGSYIAAMTASSTDGAGTTASTGSIISASLPTVVSIFTVVSSSKKAPLTMSFTSAATYNGNGTFANSWWKYGDTTSASYNPPMTYIYTTTSHTYGTGSWTASLCISESAYYGMSTSILKFSASMPTLSASIIGFSTSSRIAPLIARLSGSSVYDGHDAGTGWWDFYDGTSSSFSVPAETIPNGGMTLQSYYAKTYGTGSWTSSFQITQSLYGIVADAYVMFSASAPTLTAGFTATSASKVDFVTASFTASALAAMYNGHGDVTGIWDFFDGVTASYTPMITHIYATGSCTASLNLTESSYNFMSTAYLTFSQSAA